MALERSARRKPGLRGRSQADLSRAEQKTDPGWRWRRGQHSPSRGGGGSALGMPRRGGWGVALLAPPPAQVANGRGGAG